MPEQVTAQECFLKCQKEVRVEPIIGKSSYGEQHDLD